MAEPETTTTGTASADVVPTTTTNGAASEATPAPAADPIAQMRAEFSAQLAQQREETLTALRTVVGIITQQTAANGDAAPDPDAARAKVREQLEQDPEAAIEAIVAKRLGPVLREGAERTGRLAREEARRIAEQNDFGDDWKELAPEVEKFMAGIPADQHVDPKVWFDAFRLVLLDKDQLGQRIVAREKRKLDREQQMASEAASSGRIDPKRPSPLSESEKRIAKAAGISEDAYRANRDALRQMREGA